MLGLVVERVRALAFVGALDAVAFRAAVVRALRNRDDLAPASALVAAARPSFAADACWPLLDLARPESERFADLDDTLFDVRARITRGLRALRIAASMGSLLGFIGAAIEIHWIFNGDHGLLRLQAGLVESIALGHAVLSIALGIGTSALALGSWAVLKDVGKRALSDTHRLVGTVEDLLGIAARELSAREEE